MEEKKIVFLKWQEAGDKEQGGGGGQDRRSFISAGQKTGAMNP